LIISSELGYSAAS